jgi:hypothetical protein
VEQCVTSRINDGGSWRRGIAEARRRLRVVLCAQDGGTVWRRGDVDGKPSERFRFGLTPWR